MDHPYVNPAWLKKQTFTLRNIYLPPTIDGLVLKDLNPILDGRGELTELFSLPWMQKENWMSPVHMYQTATDFGVTKAWHLHVKHTDQVAVTRGKVQLVLVDVRKESSTFGDVNSLFMGSLRPALLKIPPGIMHGWKALSSPEVIIINFQTDVYDPPDEYKFPPDCVLTDIWEPKNG